MSSGWPGCGVRSSSPCRTASTSATAVTRPAWFNGKIRPRGDAAEDLLPGLVRAHGFERAVGRLDREVHVAPVADVHELARPLGADEQMGHVLDRFLRRREPDSLDGTGERFQPLDREREV